MRATVAESSEDVEGCVEIGAGLNGIGWHRFDAGLVAKYLVTTAAGVAAGGVVGVVPPVFALYRSARSSAIFFCSASRAFWASSFSRLKHVSMSTCIYQHSSTSYLASSKATFSCASLAAKRAA